MVYRGYWAGIKAGGCEILPRKPGEDFIKKGDEDNYFSQAIKNIKQALQELANENEDYKFKVEKILK